MFPFIPDGKGELPVEVFEHLRPRLLVQVHKNFGVRLGVEAMAPRFKIRTQLGVVEDLPVEHDPHGAVFVVDRLVPAAQIDDAQPGVGEARGPIEIKTGGIRPPVLDEADHLLQKIRVRGFIGFEIYDSGYAAHGASLLSLFEFVEFVGLEGKCL